MDANARDALEALIREHHEAGRMAEAATVALRGYGPELLGFLCGLHRDEDVAREIFAVFGEDLWRGLARFAWQSSFRTWAYVLARNASHRYRRDPQLRRGRRLETVELAQLVDELVRSETAPELRTTFKDGIAQLRAALAPDDQALLTLRIDRALSWQDVARILGAETLGERPEPQAVEREAARLRKRFERLKTELRRKALASGLISAPDDTEEPR